MARDERQIPQLRTVDDTAPKSKEVVRLRAAVDGSAIQENRPEAVKLPVAADARKKPQGKQLQASEEERPAQRKVGGAGKSHEPGIEEIMDRIPTAFESIEHQWGAELHRKPVAWGWFALIGALMVTALIWSLSSVKDSEESVTEVKQQAQVAEKSEAEEEMEAMKTIEQLEQAIRDFYDAASVERMISLVRQPERVGPLVRNYYADKEFLQPRLRVIRNLRPIDMGVRGDFWSATVVVTDQLPRMIVLEITPQGVRVDWETAVGYQPMPWDEFVARRPAGSAMDFRVIVKPDEFFSHEFADSGQWRCFLLSVPSSVETLFGYAKADSEVGRQLEDLFERKPPNQQLILRLTVPEGLHSPRGVVIDRLMATRWIYLEPPLEGR